MSLESQRRQQQLDWLASGRQIEVGNRAALPLPLEQLAAVTNASPQVTQAFESGLTAHVYKLAAAGRDWTLKRRRPQSLVKNVDGQTSFLNEVQRRRDFAALKHESETASQFTHIVETRYASLHHGVILSPWIDGERLQCFDARVYDQLFGTLVNLELNGLFEWDLCPGNVLDDGARLTLFDFGYLYRFDPRRHFNSNGCATPLFHAIERFETRNFFDHLLRNPAALDETALLAAFREEKTHALAHYEDKLKRLERIHADQPVLGWQRAINQRWQQALRGADALQRLYLVESFRSNVLDLLDDLHGQSCTPMTLRKAEHVLALLRQHFTLLREADGLFFGDESATRDELVAKYRQLKDQALKFQLAPAPASCPAHRQQT